MQIALSIFMTRDETLFCESAIVCDHSWLSICGHETKFHLTVQHQANSLQVSTARYKAFTLWKSSIDTTVRNTFYSVINSSS